MLKKIIISTGLFAGIAGFSSAQSIERAVVSSQGEVKSASGIELSYTVGESVVTTETNSTLIISQGFQQGYPQVEDTTTSSEEFVQDLNLKLYPNPSQNQVFVSDVASRSFSLSVFDDLGKMVHAQNLELNQNEQHIDLSNWSVGTYHFRFVDQDTKQVIHYQVVKQ
jgi:hypothetical protein